MGVAHIMVEDIMLLVEKMGAKAHLSFITKCNYMNKARLFGIGSVVTAALVGLTPMVAAAQYSTTTAAANVNTAISDVGATIGQVVPTILVLLAALIGLGWGVRKFKSHVSGRKF